MSQPPFSAVKEAVTILVVNQPITPVPLLWSRTGEGKSSFAEALARKLNYNFYQITASQIDPSLVLGIPVPDGDARVTRFFAPEFYATPRLLLLLDEINTAPESVVAATMETIRTRRLGGRVFEDLKIIAAANPYDEAAGGFVLPRPLRNRLVHFNWDLPLDEFAVVTAVPPHRRAQQTQQDDVEIKIARAEDVELWWAAACGWVDGFLTRFPHLYKEQRAVPDDVNAFPSPRAWDNVKAILAVFKAVSASDIATYLAIAGCVGDGVAHEFVTYLRALDMPSVEDVLANPSLLTRLRADVLLAVISAIPAVVARRAEAVDSAFDVALQLENMGRKDYAYLLARRLVAVCTNQKIPIPMRKLLQFKDAKFLESVRALSEVLSDEKKPNASRNR